MKLVGFAALVAVVGIVIAGLRGFPADEPSVARIEVEQTALDYRVSLSDSKPFDIELSLLISEVPAPLPANPAAQPRCRNPWTVAITTSDREVRVYGPCARPAEIERLRQLVVAIDRPGSVPLLEQPLLRDAQRLIEDWFGDGTIDDRHSCAAALVALHRVPLDSPQLSIHADVSRFVDETCPAGVRT